MTEQVSHEVAIDATHDSIANTENNGNIMTHETGHSSQHLVKEIDQSLMTLNVANDLAGTADFEQDQVDEEDVSKKQSDQMHRNSTILAENDSVRQSRDSADVQHVLKTIEQDDPLRIDQQDAHINAHSSIQSSQYKMLKTQNMELSLENKPPLSTNEDETGNERQDALMSENPPWERSRDLTPITNQTNRERKKNRIIYDYHFKNTDPALNQFHLSPRSINVHQQAKILKSQEANAIMNNTFPQRKYKRKNIRPIKHEPNLQDYLQDLAMLSDGSKSRSRSPVQINSDLSSKIALQTSPAKLQEPLEILGANGQMRPNFDPVKKDYHAFHSFKQKPTSPLNIQVRARTSPFQKVMADGRTCSINTKFQRVMPVVESTHGYSQGSQETYVFASSWKNNGDVEVSADRQNTESEQRQKLVSATTDHVPSTADPQNIVKMKTPNDKSRQMRKGGFNRLLTQQVGEIKEERNSSFTVAQKIQVQPLQSAIATVCPNSADADIDAGISQMEQKFVKSYESNDVMSQKTGSDNKSSIMMQNNSQIYTHQVPSPDEDNQTNCLGQEKQSQPIEVQIQIEQTSDDDDNEHNQTVKDGRNSTPLQKPQMIEAKIVSSNPGSNNNVESIQGAQQSKLNTFASVVISQEGNTSRAAFKAAQIQGRAAIVQTPQILCSSSKGQVVWSPQNTKRLPTQDVWKRPQHFQDGIEPEIKMNLKDTNKTETNQALPKIIQQGSYRNSIYTSDRTKNLYTNMKRIAQVVDPNKSLTDRQKQDLPEDKSFKAHLNNSMPRTLKPRALGMRLDNPTPGQLAFMQTTQIIERHKAKMSPTFASRTQRNRKMLPDMTSIPAPRYDSQVATPQAHYNNDLSHTRYQQSMAIHQNQQANNGDQFQQMNRRHLSTSVGGQSSSPTAVGQETHKINFANLADYPNRGGSRLQRQVEGLNVLGTLEGSRQEQQSTQPDEELPAVANTVKQWLHDTQNKDLVLKKHQEVLAQRVGYISTYKGKKSIDQNFHRPVRIDINRTRHAAGTSKSNYSTLQQPHNGFDKGQSYSRQDTLNIQQNSTIKQAEESRLRQVSPAYDIFTGWQLKEPHQNSIQESSLELQDPRSRTTRNTKFFNDSCFIEDKQTRAISPKLKKNLLISLPAPTMHPQQTRFRQRGETTESQKMLQKGEIVSRTGISMAAPTIEVFSNADNVSEDRSLYKAGRECERTITLGISERSPPISQNRVRGGGLGNYDQIAPTDFAITVVSQNINLRAKPENLNRRKPKAPVVPHIKGIAGMEKDVFSQTKPETHMREQQMNTGLKFRNDNTAPLTLRTVQIAGDQTTFNTNTMTPNSIGEDRMAPAPLISGRQMNTGDSSKDDYGSSPSNRNYGSIDQNQMLDPTIKREAVDSIDSDRKMMINCLAHDSTTGEQNNSTVLTRLLKGQNPSLLSSQNVAVLNLEDVSCIKKTELESGRVSPKQQLQTTILFHLNTLYSAQSRAWQKYDTLWDEFEKDHVRSQAPIPQSAQFLLVHLIQKTQNKGFFKRLTETTPIATKTKSGEIDTDLISCTSKPEGGQKTPLNLNDLKQGFKQLGLQKLTSVATPTIRAPSKVSKVYGTDHVQLDILDEAYKQARIRMQMCQSSLLFKFNDDDRRIFEDLRSQLTETYEKIKRSNCCISSH